MTTRKCDLPMIPFAAREAWLEEHHTTLDGLWLEIAGKGSGRETVSLPESSTSLGATVGSVVEDQPRQGE
jgi:hypothetical protein